MEEWKWVKGYEGLYEVSNTGKIRSYNYRRNGYDKSLRVSTDGYVTATLMDHGRKRKTRMHVVVAEAFIGDIPSGWHVHHKDGNKLNNHVSNLQIIHPKEHRIESEKQNPNIVKGLVDYNCYKKPRRISQYDLDGHFIAEYANAKIASVYTRVCKRNILQVANKDEYKPGMIRKQAGGFVWRFSDKGVV